MTRHKAPHGQGGVSRRPRKDGRYSASLVIDGHRYWRYGRTKRAALDQLAKLRQAAAEHRAPVDERLTVATVLDDWLAAAKARVTPSTYRRYSDIVRLHLAPSLGTTRLARLRPADVRTMLDELPVGAGTRRNVYGVLTMAIAQAVREGLVTRNVAQLVDAPKAPASIGQALTSEQARTLLGAVREERWEAVYVLLLTTGMRINEVLGLRWGDIDLEAATVTVSGTLTWLKGKGIVRSDTTKGKKPRTLPLLPVAADALRRRKGVQLEERLAGGAAWRDTGFIVTTGTGGPLSDAQWRVWGFYPLLARLELPRIRPHDLRHSVGTLLTEEGVPLAVVSRLLGHSSVAITGDRYIHVDHAMLGDAAAALGRLFSA